MNADTDIERKYCHIEILPEKSAIKDIILFNLDFTSFKINKFIEIGFFIELTCI